MGTAFVWIVTILAGGIAFSTRFVPTEEDITATFQEAQRLYAAEDYEQAIEKYGAIAQTRSRLLDVETVEVTIGEITAPIGEAALYQSGNAYMKMAEEFTKKADRSDDEKEGEDYRREARELLEQATSVFSELESSAKTPKMRALAQSRLMTSWYQIKDYERTIEEGKKLIDRYSDSEYVVEALYDIAWSYYELKDFTNSIQWFGTLIERFPKGYRSDRAIFQIGESYFQQEQYREAIPSYQKVVERTNVYNLTERDLMRMRREKLAGLVDETALELAAKAQIKIGDAYARLADLDQAAEAYRLVIKFFSQERRFAEEGYVRLAEMYFNQRNFEACVKVYRDAIDQISDRLFRARMQYLLAERYYEADRFEEAIEHYRLYEKGYGEVASQAGIPLDQIAYRIGRAFYNIGDRSHQQGEDEKARMAYRQAITEFEEAQRRYPESELRVAVAFNIALAYQMIDEEETRQQAFKQFRAIIDDDPNDPYAAHALLQVARLSYRVKDYQQAAEVYRRVASTARDSMQVGAARFELGIVLRDSGDWESAVEAFLSVGQGVELWTRSRLEVGVLLIDHSEWERALSVLDEGLSASGNREEQVKYQYLRGKALSGLGRYQEAVRAFTVAGEGTPDERLGESILFGRAMAYANAQTYDRAAADLQRLTESQNGAMRRAALKALGGAYIRQGKEREAIESYRILAAATEDSTERVDALFLLAELYDARGESERVIEVAQQVLASAVEDRKIQDTYFLKEKAYYLLGTAYTRQGNAEGTVRAYSEGLSRYPRGLYGADMRFGLGVARFQLGDLEGAVETFRRFVEDYPQSPNVAYAYHYLGFAYFDQALFREAVEYFERVGDRFPQSEVAAEALFRAGESLFNLRQFEKALERYRQVMERYPTGEVADDALYSAAWSLFNIGREAEGAEYFQQLLERYPASSFVPSARFSLGDYDFNQHEYAKAKAEYLRVERDFPGHDLAKKVPELLVGLTEIEAYAEYENVLRVVQPVIASKTKDRGRLQEALTVLRGFVEKYPGTQIAVGALNNIGVCYEGLHEWREAVAVYDGVIARYEAGKIGGDVYLFAKEHREWIVEAKL
ncbi:MAG: tetratricopeptide repeat protein [Candidatus Latescibacteria bacterium]|nr:tetratricopeptide repeat protein [Candidatus Latescibacterota bacterium]